MKFNDSHSRSASRKSKKRFSRTKETLFSKLLTQCEFFDLSTLQGSRTREVELATHELDEKNLQEEYASTVNKFIVSYCLLRNEYIPAKRARPASNENLTDLLGSKQCDLGQSN